MEAQALVTFWLYYGGEPIGAVRLPPTATPAEVRAKAVDWHNRVPLNFPPVWHQIRLMNAEVRR